MKAEAWFEVQHRVVHFAPEHPATRSSAVSSVRAAWRRYREADGRLSFDEWAPYGVASISNAAGRALLRRYVKGLLGERVRRSIPQGTRSEGTRSESKPEVKPETRAPFVVPPMRKVEPRITNFEKPAFVAVAAPVQSAIEFREFNELWRDFRIRLRYREDMTLGAVLELRPLNAAGVRSLKRVLPWEDVRTIILKQLEHAGFTDLLQLLQDFSGVEDLAAFHAQVDALFLGCGDKQVGGPNDGS